MCNKCLIPQLGQWCNELCGIKLITPQEMRKETHHCIQKAYGQSKKPRPKSFLKTYMRVTLNETN
jgi:hypothetical protein